MTLASSPAIGTTPTAQSTASSRWLSRDNQVLRRLALFMVRTEVARFTLAASVRIPGPPELPSDYPLRRAECSAVRRIPERGHIGPRASLPAVEQVAHHRLV